MGQVRLERRKVSGSSQKNVHASMYVGSTTCTQGTRTKKVLGDCKYDFCFEVFPP